MGRNDERGGREMKFGTPRLVRLIETGERTKDSGEFGYNLIVNEGDKEVSYYQNRAILKYGQYVLEEKVFDLYLSYFFPEPTSVENRKKADLLLYKRAKQLTNKTMNILAGKLMWIFAYPQLMDETQMFKSLSKKGVKKQSAKSLENTVKQGGSQ
jgi:hypothetical protein